MNRLLIFFSFFLLFPLIAQGEDYIGIVNRANNVTEDEWEKKQAEIERRKKQAIIDQRQETVRLQQSQGLQAAPGLPAGAGNLALSERNPAASASAGQFQQLQALQAGTAPSAAPAGQKKKDDYDDKIEKTSVVLGENQALLMNGDQERYSDELAREYESNVQAVYAGQWMPPAEFRKFIEKKMKKVK